MYLKMYTLKILSVVIAKGQFRKLPKTPHFMVIVPSSWQIRSCGVL